MNARLIVTAAAALVLAAAGFAAISVRPPSSPSPPSLTERNRTVITTFARIFYRERNVRGAFERFVVPDYIQHNPGITDGRDAAIAALAPMFAVAGSRFDVKRIAVDGDLAVIHLLGRGDPKGRGGAVADIYRLANGRIVEHWDVIQPIPATAANPHPIF